MFWELTGPGTSRHMVRCRVVSGDPLGLIVGAVCHICRAHKKAL
jgi:hypothetical protein